MLAPTRNPLIRDTLKSRLRQFWCDKFGCIETGSYYGMPQAWCRRCGHINKHLAGELVKEWYVPDGYEEDAFLGVEDNKHGNYKSD